jgi:3-(3-hydroxy-phenyl)propionate hydroxylase
LTIVGAGPAGLLAALGFAAHSIDTVVIEAGPVDVAPEWRGSTLHPPTVEILDDLGLADEALAAGIRVDRLQYRDLVLDDVVELHYRAIADRTRFPFRLQYEQYKLLTGLRRAADASPHVTVHYECPITQVEPGDDASPALVTVRPAGATERSVTARWLIGADGSHSIVRAALGVGMAGDTYPTSSLVVATDVAFEQLRPGLGPVSYWTGPTGRMSLIRTPDTWRVALSTSEAVPGPDTTEAGIEPRADGLHEHFLAAISRLCGERAWRDGDVRQHETYRSHQRVADNFRVGRTVLIGDAAHLTATTGGMGLNAGLHDADDLVHRLAGALASGRDEHAAATAYANARRQVALEIIQPATRAARAESDLTDLAARRDRLTRLQSIASDDRRAAAFLAKASMLDALDHLGR